MVVRRDEGAMPLLALVMVAALMGGPLAATLVLPATAYVWVSGFGAQSSTPAYSLSMTSAGAIVDGEKSFTIAAATPGMPYRALTFTVNGMTMAHAASCEPMASNVSVCRGGSGVDPSAMVLAGDVVAFAGVRSGDTLRVLDAGANSVILTMTIG